MAHRCCIVTIYLLLLINFTQAAFPIECRGTETKLMAYGSSMQRYEHLKKRYTGCKIVEGNVEIIKINEKDVDWSFMNSIKEITGYLLIWNTLTPHTLLPNLTIIRGKTLLSINGREYGLFIADNDGQGQPLGLVSLREISNGRISVGSNNICNLNDVLWKDITKGPIEIKENNNNCQPCSSACEEVEGKKHCWGPNEHQCQKLNTAICSGECKNGCHGKYSNQCCSSACAAGCTGSTNKDCRVCKSFFHNEACYENCSAIKNGLSRNLYSYINQCVEKCPAHMYINEWDCVYACPEGFEANKKTFVCEPCNPCPKRCTIGKYVSYKNIESLRGCIHITDSLILNMGSFNSEFQNKPLTKQQLEILQSIEVIEGHLYIGATHPNLPNLSFLKNLRAVRGKVLWEGVCSVVIHYTSMENIGLNNLKSIGNGKFCLFDNQQLCYAANKTWMAAFNITVDKLYVKNNKEENLCVKEGKICHVNCSSDGCQGPLDSDCISCKGRKMNNRCID